MLISSLAKFFAVLDLGAKIAIFFKEHARIITTVELEKCITGTCVFGIIISKLYHRQKPSLVILILINKGPKVGFNGAILSLNLTISL